MKSIILYNLHKLSEIEALKKHLNEHQVQSIKYLKDFYKATREISVQFAIIKLKKNTIEKLKEIEYWKPTIFVSDAIDSDTYQELKKLGMVAYVKPTTDIFTFLSIIDNHLGNESSSSTDTFYYRKKGKVIPISKSEIRYIETKGNDCRVLVGEELHIMRYPIENLIEEINCDYIVRIHRRFAVNLTVIEEMNVSSNYIKIGDAKLPVGRTFKKKVKQSLASSR